MFTQPLTPAPKIGGRVDLCICMHACWTSLERRQIVNAHMCAYAAALLW
jgi:hypothetical protein